MFRIGDRVRFDPRVCNTPHEGVGIIVGFEEFTNPTMIRVLWGREIDIHEPFGLILDPREVLHCVPCGVRTFRFRWYDGCPNCGSRDALEVNP